METLYGEKIIESLHVIKTVCEDNIDNCVMCPFKIIHSKAWTNIIKKS